jgi:hypothetical protein
MMAGMSWQRLLGGIIPFTVVVFMAVAWLSDFPTGKARENTVIHFGWRLAGAKVKVCRKWQAGELENLPSHMRAPQFCDEQGVNYNLTVILDGKEIIHKAFTPPGVRGDRPLFVFEEYPLHPGIHQVYVKFAPDTEALELQRDSGAPLLEQYRYVGEINAKAGRIVLVELEPNNPDLIVRY